MDKTTTKWIARVVFYAIAVGLFVYAASRSLDFITATLPPSQKIVGYLGLLATGGGAIGWLVTFLFHAQGTGQKGLSIVFVVLDLLGEAMLFTFDTLYRSSQTGMIASLSQDQIQMVIVGLSALIFLNIAAITAFHLLDPATSRRMREESARDVLDNAVLETIENRAPQLANQIAPQIAAQWEADFAQRFGDMSALGLGHLSTSQSTATHGQAMPSSPRSLFSWLLGNHDDQSSQNPSWVTCKGTYHAWPSALFGEPDPDQSCACGAVKWSDRFGKQDVPALTPAPIQSATDQNTTSPNLTELPTANKMLEEAGSNHNGHDHPDRPFS